MKTKKMRLAAQRKIVQLKIDQFAKTSSLMPPSGWIKALRGALGLTIRQLADRMGVSHGSINQIEKREPLKKVTLDSLEQIANAMDCKLVYALVPKDPKETLDDIIRRKALVAAEKILAQVSHSMRLEAQGTDRRQINDEISRVAGELIESHDPRIWESTPKKASKG